MREMCPLEISKQDKERVARTRLWSQNAEHPLPWILKFSPAGGSWRLASTSTFFLNEYSTDFHRL